MDLGNICYFLLWQYKKYEYIYREYTLRSRHQGISKMFEYSGWGRMDLVLT